MSAQVQFQTTAPPFRWDEAGGIRIGQSRVTLDSILSAYQAGSTPEEIAVQYSVLELADIYAAITYYLTYHQQIDSCLTLRRQQAQQRRQQFVQKHNLADLRQRLLVRRKSQMGQQSSASSH